MENRTQLDERIGLIERNLLERLGRTDLIGDGCDALIPARPPREAILKRREKAGKQFAVQDSDIGIDDRESWFINLGYQLFF